MRISYAETEADVSEMRALFVEYQEWLGVDLCFQGFEAELRDLPGKYAPPRGRMLLVRDGERAAGCVAFCPLEEDGVCEMKRLYVRAEWRGTGLGKRLAERIVDEARAAGYSRMRLDTLSHLDAAIGIYRTMGFREIEAYYHNPEEGVVYMELDL